MKKSSYNLFLLTALFFYGCQHTNQIHPLKIDTLSLQYRTEDSFKGILEAITHKKSTNGRMILRTQPDVREGIYFIITFNHSINTIPVNSSIKITYITNLEPKEQITQWTIPPVNYSLYLQNEIYLGVTNIKKYSNQTKLIAWNIDIIAPNGQIIANKHSFAW